ncbi:MAG: peptide chain release factor 1 [Parachlamydiales bacterium]|nr:peptide chain release factor 1 [Parachlamydiales bacterium]
MEVKIKKLLSRLEEVEKILGDPATLADQKLYRELTQEHAYLSELKEQWQYYCRVREQLSENQVLLTGERDPEMIQVIREELVHLQAEIELAQKRLQTILVPPDPNDSRTILLEIRAGTGGDEAAIFVGDCVRMYRGYAARKGWNVETLSLTPSDKGGFKEYIMSLSGPNVFRFMKYEAGTHRVQRVPETEAQGRLHTSAITVAVLLEPTDDEDIMIDEKDLKIDTYRSSGAGGQHVNVTDSAVRITHLPTNTVVTCQDERSQHKNKDKAMRLLRARIREQKLKEQQREISNLRSIQVGTGDRSERIRTYNFPQNRLTDHRIDLTLYHLDLVMEGDLDEITQSLVSYYYQKELTSS